MIRLEKRPIAKIATGQYINLYGKDGVDLLILINEANGEINDRKMIEVTSFLEEVSAQYNLKDIDDKELGLELEDKYFAWGVQIFRIKRGCD